MIVFLCVLLLLLGYANYQLGEVRNGLFPQPERHYSYTGAPIIVWLARSSVVAVFIALAWCLFAVNR